MINNFPRLAEKTMKTSQSQSFCWRTSFTTPYFCLNCTVLYDFHDVTGLKVIDVSLQMHQKKINKTSIRQRFATSFVTRLEQRNTGSPPSICCASPQGRDKKSATMFWLPQRYLKVKSNSCNASAQPVSLALLVEAEVMNARRLKSENTVKETPKH